jgi:hypothetical protein
MNRNFKIAPVFFLWIGWLFMTAHLVIPHDHHLLGSNSGSEDECPLSKGKTGHNTGFPIHCHAFNDLASEKARPYVIGPDTQYNNLAYSILYDISSFGLQRSNIQISELRKNIIDDFILEFTSLRAPPSVC